jgi:hypothetical protein
MTRVRGSTSGGLVNRVTTRRAIVLVLVLVATGLLLAVPGGASAHVKAKYKAEYRAKLTAWQNMFAIYENQFWATRTQSNNLAATMATEMEDPDKRAQLLAHEQYALTVYNNTESLPDEWARAIHKAINADLRKAPRWFASANDRKSFKAVTKRVSGCFSILMFAHNAVSRSFLALSSDPPALGKQASAIADGDKSVGDAKSFFSEALAALRKLL